MIKVRDLCDSDEQFKFLKLIIKEFNAQEVSFYENVVRKGIKIISRDLMVKLKLN